MTIVASFMSASRCGDAEFSFDDAELAAAGFLARHRGRTLEAYRYDLRCYFQWTADVDVHVLEATRPHIELIGKGRR